MYSFELKIYISMMHKNGLSYRKIEILTNIPKSTVCRWYNLYSSYLFEKINVKDIKELNNTTKKYA